MIEVTVLSFNGTLQAYRENVLHLRGICIYRISRYEIKLLTAIWLTLGGSSTVRIYTQYAEQHNLFGKSAGQVVNRPLASVFGFRLLEVFCQGGVWVAMEVMLVSLCGGSVGGGGGGCGV